MEDNSSGFPGVLHTEEELETDYDESVTSTVPETSTSQTEGKSETPKRRKRRRVQVIQFSDWKISVCYLARYAIFTSQLE